MEETAVERAVARAGQQREARLGKAARRASGTVHTPPVLARLIARGADELLRQRLGLAAGLADHRVSLIDPACGPGAFLAASLAVAGERVGRPAIAVGMDRDAGAVAMARALLRGPLSRACWDNELAVLDTLDDVEPATVAERAEVCVVIGNPPWIGRAQPPPSPWLAALLEDFRRDGTGARLQERKLGVLADAYVRFMRWGAEVVRRARGGGVLAMVTGGSYLDGPVHRGMREALMRYFDELHVIDLGGSALLAKPGLRDGNVFGVRTSAAVLLGVRGVRCDEGRHARVLHRALTGSAEEKLAQLARLEPCAGGRALVPAAPHFRFVPTAATGAGYARWPSLAELMPFHREGVQTNRDAVVVAPSRQALLERLRRFVDGADDAELAVARRPLAHYDPERARLAVRDALQRDPDGELGISARPLLYRPFDRRWFAPVAPLCHRPRPKLLRAMDHSALALVTVRKDRSPAPWAHFGVSDVAIDNCLLSTRSSCRARAFPMHGPDGRPNLGASLLSRARFAIAPRDFIHYALAILAAPRYRDTHAEALRIDYPRIPPPTDRACFERVARAGAQLAALLLAEPRAGGERSAGAEGELHLGHHALSLADGRLRALQAALQVLDDVVADALG